MHKFCKILRKNRNFKDKICKLFYSGRHRLTSFSPAIDRDGESLIAIAEIDIDERLPGRFRPPVRSHLLHRHIKNITADNLIKFQRQIYIL